MLRLLLAAVVVMLSTSVEANQRSQYHGYGYRHHHHYYSYHYRGFHHPRHRSHVSIHVRHGLNLVTVQTAAGKSITVAKHLAKRFQYLISDLVAAGYKPKRINCYASSGHVPHSRHYLGEACDFDGSLSRSSFMRSSIAAKIIAKHGFRNGCSFYSRGVRDCGHVDNGLPKRRHRIHRRRARHTW